MFKIKFSEFTNIKFWWVLCGCVSFVVKEIKHEEDYHILNLLLLLLLLL